VKCWATADFDSGWGISTSVRCVREDEHWLHRHVDIDGEVLWWSTDPPVGVR
jgi:hypothetical protein